MGIDRRRRQAFAWIALGAFVASLVFPWVLSTHRIGDRDIAGLLVPADHLATSLSADVEQNGQEHCAVCHWLRTVGDRTSAKLAPLSALAERAGVLAPHAAPHADRLVIANAPSRAPPQLA